MNDLPMRNEWHEWPASKKGWMTWMTYQWERINVMNDLPMRKVEWHEWPTNEIGWMTNDLPMKKKKMNDMNDIPMRKDEWRRTYQWKRMNDIPWEINDMNDIPWEMNDMNNLPMRKDKLHEWPTDEKG